MTFYESFCHCQKTFVVCAIINRFWLDVRDQYWFSGLSDVQIIIIWFIIEWTCVPRQLCAQFTAALIMILCTCSTHVHSIINWINHYKNVSFCIEKLYSKRLHFSRIWIESTFCYYFIQFAHNPESCNQNSPLSHSHTSQLKLWTFATL